MMLSVIMVRRSHLVSNKVLDEISEVHGPKHNERCCTYDSSECSIIFSLIQQKALKTNPLVHSLTGMRYNREH